MGVPDVSIEPGCIYVVATPIGNLGDLSARAAQCLSEVGIIAAEDTRRTRQLLQHLGVDKPLLSLHEHNERGRIDGLAKRLERGESVALVSDAGTPLISDPGFPVVRALAKRGFRIVPIPGACSLIAALCAAGLPTDRFLFEGFLPARQAARRQLLCSLAAQPRTLVFLETAKRIRNSLQDMEVAFGADREVVLARELTKLYEEFLRGTVRELRSLLESEPNRCRGEFVVLVGGATEVNAKLDDARDLMTALVAELPVSRASAVAARATGLSRNDLYRLGLELTRGQT